MGWGSGSDLMSRIIGELQKSKTIRPEVRAEVYKILIPAFESQDWDTQYDCLGQDAIFDQVLERLNEQSAVMD